MALANARDAATGSAGSAEKASSRPGWVPAFDVWLLQYRRIWRGSVIGSFLEPLLFLLSMGIGLGSLVDASSGGVDGVPYLVFVVPGILAGQAMFGASGEATYAVMGAVKWQMQYPCMLATPLRPVDVVRGHLTYMVAKITAGTVIFMAMAAAFGAVSSWWYLLCLPLSVLMGAGAAAMIFAFAVRQEEDGGFNILFRFVVTPLFLFSGTFFPIDSMPEPLQVLAWSLPLAHGVAGNRELALGSPDWAALGVHTAYLVVFLVVGCWLALHHFRKRLVV